MSTMAGEHTLIPIVHGLLLFFFFFYSVDLPLPFLPLNGLLANGLNGLGDWERPIEKRIGHQWVSIPFGFD